MTDWTTEVTRLLPMLRRYALSLTKEQSAADDLVQQSLLRGIERSDSFIRGRSLKSWLLAIVHNEFVSDRRRLAVEQRKLDTLASDAQSAVSGDQEWAIYVNEVSARFARLPNPQRAVLHLIAVEGLSYQQAAEALDLPIGTVMSRLARARAALREPQSEGAARTLHIVGGTDAS